MPGHWPASRVLLRSRSSRRSISLLPLLKIRLEKEYTTIKNKEMEEQIEIKVRVEGDVLADAPALHAERPNKPCV